MIGSKRQNNVEQRMPHHFAAHFWSILRLLNGRRSSQLSIAFLILLCALEEILIYHIGLISAQFYYILLLKDVYKFYIQLAITLALILFMSIIKSAKNYVSSVLHIEWREYVSELLITHYFDDLNYYFLSHPVNRRAEDEKSTGLKEDKTYSMTLDNIDQRLSTDTDRLCAELSSVLSQTVLSPLTILYYSYKVYTTIGLYGLLACIATFLASTAINRVFIKSIAKWTYLKGKHEGDYRTVLFNSIQNSETIAFTNAATKEKNRTLDSLKTLMSVYENFIFTQFFLNLSTSIFDYSGSVLSFIIIAVPIFGGSFDHLSKAELSRTISSNAFVCMYLIHCFSKILDTSSNFGQVNGFGHRITELLIFFKQNNQPMINRSKTLPFSNESHQLLLQLSDVNVLLPSIAHQCALNFQVKIGENVLITGDSDQEKTAILGVIKGFWPISSGTVKCALDLNDNTSVMFLCHNAKLGYLFQEEITADCEMKSKAMQYLDKFSLNKVLESKDGASSASLTAGQQQIINFVIVFCLQPRLVFLNDATNSLTEQMTDQLYEECKRLSITVVTIASNANLEKFHTHCIHLSKDLA